MTNEKLFSKDELLAFNEMMLGRGMPVQEDGIGYNKADYGACATYFYGLSDAQVADLAKRLVKYCNTQLGVEKDLMKATAKYYAELAGDSDRNDGISLEINEDGTLISFRYNELFIDIIKKQPRRQYDGERKNWVVPNADVYKVLAELEEVGADIKGAMEYAMNNELILEAMKPKKIEILTKIEDDVAYLKFEYNQDIVNEIKRIRKDLRQYNPQYKYWAIAGSLLSELKEHLCDIAHFKHVN